MTATGIRTGAFQSSISSLVELAFEETLAVGCAAYQFSACTGQREQFFARGAAIPVETLKEPHPFTRVYDIQNGAVAFSFKDREQADLAQAKLDVAVEIIASVWEASERISHSIDLVDRLVELEASLLDSKIADRARGILREQRQGPPADAIAAMKQHVEGVLRASSTRGVLEGVLSDLEDQLEERRLVTEAKQILQSTHGMPEGQAHSLLRVTSRKTRKKLKQVAQEVIDSKRKNARSA